MSIFRTTITYSLAFLLTCFSMAASSADVVWSWEFNGTEAGTFGTDGTLADVNNATQGLPFTATADPPDPLTTATNETVDAAQAVKRLQDGNARFVAGKPRHPHETSEWRHKLEKEQHPFAVVLGCSDSRVPPELVFDQGFGDLFVVRVAGQKSFLCYTELNLQ